MPDSAALNVLCLGAAPPGLQLTPWGRIDLVEADSLDAAARRLGEQAFDAVLVVTGPALPVAALAAWEALSQAVLDAAVVVVADGVPVPLVAGLVEQGVQDVLPPAAGANDLARALHLAVWRRRLERTARKAYATDLATGLPNHAQLREHMTHLLALREREPAPMALLVLRIDGLATTAASLGAEAANVLRRKAAVRLRAGLRASDVVASIGHDAFAVLLAWIDAPADAQRVADKLAQALRQPFNVAGQAQALAVAVGISRSPEDGRVADELLRRALGQAAAMAAAGRAGFVNRAERGPTPAANDDE